MNLIAELDLLDENVPKELGKYLSWKFKTGHFKVLNEYECKVMKWFNDSGEPQDFRDYYQPEFRLFVVHSGCLIIHLNSFSHYDGSYSRTTERTYLINCPVIDRVT